LLTSNLRRKPGLILWKRDICHVILPPVSETHSDRKTMDRQDRNLRGALYRVSTGNARAPVRSALLHLASFVWSKMTGYGPLTNAYDLNSSRGIMDINVPINFVASYIFAIPDVQHLGFFGKTLLSGWQIKGLTILRSGQPFNVTSGTDTNFVGTGNDRPNLIGNPHLPSRRCKIETTKAYFNTSAFATPPPGTPYGNTPFNIGELRRNRSAGIPR
jgi:hypothetical protein